MELWNLKDLGEILYEGKMVSDLLSGVLQNSSGIIGEKSELCAGKRTFAIIGCQLIVANMK